jgi:hypothetical protein
MKLEQLHRFSLMGCRFSKSTYSFELEGHLDGKFSSLLLSTTVNFSRGYEPDFDLCSQFSASIWDVFETKLVLVSKFENSKCSGIALKFESGIDFCIWSDDVSDEELLRVTNLKSREWYTFS